MTLSAQSPRRLRIAMLGSRGISTRYSGIETSLASLCPLLARDGCEITIFSWHDSIAPAHVEFVNERYIASSRVCTNNYINSAWATVAAILERKYDIYHFHGLGPACFAGIARATGKPVVVSVHGIDWQRAKWGKVARWVIQQGEFAARKHADAIIAVSQHVAKHFTQGSCPRKAIVIHNGVPLDFSSAQDSPAQIDAKRFFLFVGRLVPEKRCDLLLQAYAMSNTNLPLVIAGDGDPHYVTKLKTLPTKQVQWLGHVDHSTLTALYNQALALVLPSDLEGFPVTLLEAAQFQVCPIVSAIEPNLEATGGTGITFQQGCLDELVSAINLVSSNPGIARAQGRLFSDYAKTHFTVEAAAKAHLQLYRDLCQKLNLQATAGHTS